MGTYGLPRDVKGEGRILFIFSKKALIYTSIAIALGLPFYFLFNALGITLLGQIIVVLFGVLGFIIGTFKVPDTNSFEITKKAGGQNIDEIIQRYIAFKKKKNRIYINEEEK